MKLPTDLVAGDVFHTTGRPLSAPQIDYFRAYHTDSDGTTWADCADYSFLMDTGIAEPTDVTVVRVQRVNSCATTLEMSEKLNTKDARIEALSVAMANGPTAIVPDEPSQVINATKLAIAAQLTTLLSMYHYADSGFYVAVEKFKDDLIKEAK